MPLNGDGSLRPYNAAEISAFNLRWRGVRDGSTPTLSFEVNANRAEATCLVAWGQWQSFVVYAVGTSVVWDDAGTDRLSRLLPLRFPGRPGLVCTKVTRITGSKFLGTVDADGLPEYKDAEISLLFETPGYRVVEDDDVVGGEYERFVEVGPAATTVETISTYGGSLKFRRDPALPDPAALPNDIPVPFNTVNKMVMEETFGVTWWRVPEDLVAEGSAWQQRLYGTGDQDSVGLVGCTNTEEIFGKPVGTVLLTGARRIRDKSPVGDGTFEYRVEFEFKHRPSGWNWLWFASPLFPDVNNFYMVSSTGGFATADAVNDGASLYNARDLTAAFEP
jgi:hypothetical protein